MRNLAIVLGIIMGNSVHADPTSTPMTPEACAELRIEIANDVHDLLLKPLGAKLDAFLQQTTPDELRTVLEAHEVEKKINELRDTSRTVEAPSEKEKLRERIREYRPQKTQLRKAVFEVLTRLDERSSIASGQVPFYDGSLTYFITHDVPENEAMGFQAQYTQSELASYPLRLTLGKNIDHYEMTFDYFASVVEMFVTNREPACATPTPDRLHEYFKNHTDEAYYSLRTVPANLGLPR